MRGNPESHHFIDAANLDEILALLAKEPGEWTAIAGGTEIMVAHAAGRLSAKKLINLWGVPELSNIVVTETHLSIGGGVTFNQIRHDATIIAEFPLLAQAASWIGSIANQSRATIAGNIVNGSPAADAPPALLVYDAEIELISHKGTRRLAYSDFHTGYKQSLLLSSELVLAIHLPRHHEQQIKYLRKVGTRRAMAITKVALAGTASSVHHAITRIRIAAASVADRPLRLIATEAALLNEPLNESTLSRARKALWSEVRPIDDLRSTAEYRKQVIANLLDEFLTQIARSSPS